MSHSTHFRSLGDSGVIAASARIIATVSAEASSTAQPHSVCGVSSVDNSGVYVCLTRPCVRIFQMEVGSAWLFADARVKVYSRETHSRRQASKTYGHNPFQIIHIYTPLLSTVVALHYSALLIT